MSIPPDISKVLLPQDDLNVVDLVDFTISKGTKSAPDLLVMQDSELFLKIASVITSEKHVAFLHSLAIPTAMQVGLIQERLEKVSEDEEIPKSLAYPLSATHSPGSPNIRLPLWILEYWSKTYKAVESKDCWGPAIARLKQRKSQEVIDILRELPWKYRTPDKELDNALDISDLALFCSEEWLGSAQMDAMSAVLNDQLSSIQVQASVQPNNFFQKLLATYRFSHEKYFTELSTYYFLRKIADNLKSGALSVLSTAIAVRLTQNGVILPEGQQSPSNHWCALIIDVNQHTLHYGDPMGSPPPAELVDVMSWWLGLSFTEGFTFRKLPITQQTDDRSCSVFTINALAHYFIPSVPLLLNGPPCLLARTDMLIKTINLLKKRVSCSIHRFEIYLTYISGSRHGCFQQTWTYAIIYFLCCCIKFLS